MKGSVIRIERKDASAGHHAEALRRALLAANRPDVTPAEAAAVSGLPIASSEEALWHLASELAPRIRVGTDGALRFTFTTLERARPTIGDWVHRHAMALKLAGLLLLVPPYLLTVGAHALALTHPAVPLGPMGGVLGLVGAIAAVPVLLVGIGSFFQFQLMPFGGPTLVAVALGMLLPAWLRNPDDTFSMILTPLVLLMGVAWSAGAFLFFRHYVFGGRNLAGMRLWRAVSGTLFGGDLALDGGLTDEKRLTALIARKHGVITTADMVGLFGWTPEEADGQLARILLDYGGEVLVSEEGGLAYRFAELAETDPDGVDTRPLHEREPEAPAFFQAPPAFVRAFGGLTAIGLLGFALGPHPALWPDWSAPQGSLSDAVMSQGVGGMGYVAIALILAVRFAGWRRRVEAHRERAPFRHLVALAIAHPEGRYVKRPPTRELAVLGGTIDVDRTRPDGAVWVHFPAIAAAMRAAEALRADALAAGPSKAGVAFDTAGG